MPKDPRLSSIGDLIRSGEIKTFSQVFKHIPPTVIARSMKWGISRLNNVRKRPGKLTLEEVYKLAKLFKCGKELMVWVVMEEMK